MRKTPQPELRSPASWAKRFQENHKIVFADDVLRHDTNWGHADVRSAIGTTEKRDKRGGNVRESGPAERKGFADIAGNLFTKLIVVLNGVGTAWIFVMMLLVTLDVTMRTLFNAPVKAVPLIITISIVGIVFLQLSDALRAGRFTRSDVMIARLLRSRPKLGHMLQMIYNALGVFIMAVIFIFTIPFLGKKIESQAYLGNEGEFTLPEWPLAVVILIGSACCTIQYARHTWEDIRFLRGSRDSEFMGTGGVGDE